MPSQSLNVCPLDFKTIIQLKMYVCIFIYTHANMCYTSGTNTNVENEILQWIWACLNKSK